MSVKTIQLKKGSFLFREGDSSDAAYIVESGALKILKQFDLNIQEIGRVQASQIIGEMGLLDNSPRSAGAQAEVDSTIIVIPKESLTEYLSIQPAWVKAFIESIMGRLRATNERLAEALVEMKKNSKSKATNNIQNI